MLAPLGVTELLDHLDPDCRDPEDEPQVEQAFYWDVPTHPYNPIIGRSQDSHAQDLFNLEV